MTSKLFLCIAALCSATALSAAEGVYATVEYPASEKPGELIYGVTYTAWIPAAAQPIRGVIVHQHGCGTGACKGGATAAYDLHWQALAAKWNCALLGPSYHQVDGQDCRQWCDPRNGSEATFLRALDDLAKQTNHPELNQVPWCLWGHSGGGFWSSIMQTRHPDRIVAIWFRSGTAYATWEKGEIAKPDLPAGIYDIPMMLNPGAKENGDARFNGAWTGSMAMLEAYRKQGGLVGFAPDPRTSHECGDSRYLAIPFFDECLRLRLPEPDAVTGPLKKINPLSGFVAEVGTAKAEPASGSVIKDPSRMWLPSEKLATAWAEYVQVGAVSDTTPPPAPQHVKVAALPDKSIEVTWDADADFESGIQQFVILRDGQAIGSVPEKPVGRFGRPLFQTMSYHDTPEAPVPELKFIDRSNDANEKARYSVQAINSVGLKSDVP